MTGYRRTPAAEPQVDDRQVMGLSGRSPWRVHDHPEMEKVGRDGPALQLAVSKITGLSGKAPVSAMGRFLPRRETLPGVRTVLVSCRPLSVGDGQQSAKTRLCHVGMRPTAKGRCSHRSQPPKGAGCAVVVREVPVTGEAPNFPNDPTIYVYPA